MPTDIPVVPLPTTVTDMLSADGYDVVDRGMRGGQREIAIVARPGACPDCLVPKAMMLALLQKAALPSDLGVVRLLYPADGLG